MPRNDPILFVGIWCLIRYVPSSSGSMILDEINPSQEFMGQANQTVNEYFKVQNREMYQLVCEDLILIMSLLFLSFLNCEKNQN